MFTKPWKKVLTFAIIALLSISLIGCGAANNTGQQGGAGDKTVNIGLVNWAEAVAVSNLWKVILEDQGYTVKLTTLEVAPLFVGLSQGSLDVFMDAWLPITHKSYWDKYSNKLEDYGIWYDGEAKIGLVVPEYVEIDSIDELNDVSDKFKGKLTGIDPGAGIMGAAQSAIEEYGLKYELVQSSEAAMVAALDKAYRNKEWVAVTGWSPHWKFAQYDLKYLEDPKGSFGEAEYIHTVANKDFSERHPEVKEMLQKFKMDDDQIGTLESYINEGMDPVDAAKKWISENQDLVDSWIK